jgi:hypothetical protein
MSCGEITTLKYLGEGNPEEDLAEAALFRKENIQSLASFVKSCALISRNTIESS